MFAIVRGKLISSREYERQFSENGIEKVSREILISVYDGRDVIEVFGCPPCKSNFGDVITLNCDVFVTKKGSLFVRYRASPPAF